MWLEENQGERINNLRTDQILSVSPDIVAVACPYCRTMLNDGMDARQAGERTEVLDVVEILQAADKVAPSNPVVVGADL